jgi:nitroreductase
MEFRSPVADLVRRRRSCRRYADEPLPGEAQRALASFLATNRLGPLGSRARFELVAATGEDRAALRGLGTYGFIRGAPAFIVGAVGQGIRALEDYGCLLERAVLLATDLGLATCWLGGTFSKSGFARTIGLAGDELLPAVAALGRGADGDGSADRVRRMAGSVSRKPPEELFFDGGFGAPLATAAAGGYAGPLEAVRRAPSASNRQPWRIVRTPAGWHFYLERTKGYGKGTLLFALLRLADLQRVDLGIAMCHFELAAAEAGFDGGWIVEDPGVAPAAGAATYVATWRELRAEQLPIRPAPA